MFLESIDRMIVSSLRYAAPKIINLFIENKNHNYRYSSMEGYNMPKHILILPIEGYLNNKIINFIDRKYKYFLINQSNFELYCIDENLKNYLELFSTPQKQNQVINNNHQQDYFTNLLKYGFIVKYNCTNKTSRIDTLHKLESKFIFIKTLADNHRSSTYIVRKRYKHEKYVLKIFHSDNYYSSIHNEVKARELLSGHNILPDLVEVDYCRKYILMEYLNNISLTNYLTKNSSMSSRIKISQDIISMISVLHSNLVLHGDLHMGQILIDDKDTVKLLDWELLFDLSLSNNIYNLTQGGVFEYLAPETIQSNPFSPIISATPTTQSEVYRLGVIIYHIMYNEFPFIGLTWQQLYEAIKNDSLICQSKNMYGQSVPQKLVNIIEDCLRKDIRNRYSSADKIHF